MVDKLGVYDTSWQRTRSKARALAYLLNQDELVKSQIVGYVITREVGNEIVFVDNSVPTHSEASERIAQMFGQDWAEQGYGIMGVVTL